MMRPALRPPPPPNPSAIMLTLTAVHHGAMDIPLLPPHVDPELTRDTEPPQASDTEPCPPWWEL